MESEDLSFHQMVREAFLSAAASDADRYLVLDATGEPADIHKKSSRGSTNSISRDDSLLSCGGLDANCLAQ